MITTWDQPDDAPLFAFAGGGTGGHLYPALAVAGELRARVPRARILFFGTDRPIDRHILQETDCELLPQSLPRLSMVPWRWPKLVSGYRRAGADCRSHLLRRKPVIVIGTGGAGSYPAVRQAARAGIPTALLNPDAVPGRANRHLAPLTDCIFVQWESTSACFEDETHVEVTGCPVRRAFLKATRADGIQRFGLDPKLKTLLITGASLGARTINEAIVANLIHITQTPGWQILHLAGHGEFESVRDAYAKFAVRAVVLPFTEHMGEAIAAADLVVSRAGASTLAELTAIGRASILMPYPFHRDMHQRLNALCLTEDAEGPAARLVDDEKLVSRNAPKLREALLGLIRDDAARQALAESARRIGRPDAAAQVAVKLLEIAKLPVPAEGAREVKKS